MLKKHVYYTHATFLMFERSVLNNNNKIYARGENDSIRIRKKRNYYKILASSVNRNVY